MPQLFINEFKSLNEYDFDVLSYMEKKQKHKAYIPIEDIGENFGYSDRFLSKRISKLSKTRMIELKRKHKESFTRLTYNGIDALALNTLRYDDTVSSIGGLIGEGKESDVYLGYSEKANLRVVLKFHRLGKSDFRHTKKKRLFIALKKRLSRFDEIKLSAEAEMTALKIMQKAGVKVPQCIGYSRHIVVTEFIPGIELYKKKNLTVKDYQEIWNQLKKEIIKIHEAGLVHGDLSPYNILVTDNLNISIIDWPQFLNIEDKGADEVLKRDLSLIKSFFSDKINIELPNLQFP